MDCLKHARGMGSTLLLIGLLLPIAPLPLSPTAPPSASDDVPDWVLNHMASRVGRWITDNAAYQSDDEPFDAYGMEWFWGAGKKNLRGRLFALQEGQEVSTFWEFRELWHPGEQKLMLYQYGRDGTVGIGATTRLDDHQSQSLQTFFRLDGTTFRVGHRTTLEQDKQHTRSYDVGEDDVWKDRRYYLWRRTE